MQARVRISRVYALKQEHCDTHALVNACALPLIDGLWFVLAVTRGVLPARAESDAG